jgi:antitoxin HigA-1
MMAYTKPHPGEILKEDFMIPLGLSGNGLAELIGAPANRINDIVRGRRHMTADTALRLGKAFDMEPQFWMNLQVIHDMSVAKRVFAANHKAIKRGSARPTGRVLAAV